MTASPGVLKWRAPVDNKAWGQDVDKGLLTLYQLSFWDKTIYLSVVEAIWYEPLHGCLSLWLLTWWINLSQSKIKSNQIKSNRWVIMDLFCRFSYQRWSFVVDFDMLSYVWQKRWLYRRWRSWSNRKGKQMTRLVITAVVVQEL